MELETSPHRFLEAEEDIPCDILEHNPLITREGIQLVGRLRSHPHAPRFNTRAGDRLRAADLDSLDSLRESLAAPRPAAPASPAPPQTILAWIEQLLPKVPLFRHRVPRGFPLEARWEEIPTMSREEIALHPELLVPDDADLDRLIIYRTAGTTGHALLVPHHPRAAACYQPLLEHALSRHQVRLDLGSSETACFLVGAQARTVTYPTVLAAWGGAGFVKMNLSVSEWPSSESPQRYFDEFHPLLLTGDPISFGEMLRLGIESRPQAIVSTAVAMSLALKRRLEEAYRCPVLDLYSLTETGPIACGAPDGEGYAVLPADLYVEALDADGRQVPPGERGEITVSGGRNPYVPLLRYRTGDWGRVEQARAADGSAITRILDLEGRSPVLFRATDGSVVNPVDLSRVLREFPLVQHEFTQRTDASCDLVLRPLPGRLTPAVEEMEKALRQLLGESAVLRIRVDSTLGERSTSGKTLPYRSELLLEE